jgi:release factor glutamine methyltransferase
MTLKDILDNYGQSLNGIYDEHEIAATFYIVAEHLSGLNRTQILLKLDESVTIEDNEKYNTVLQRLKTQEPLQYILAEAYFYGLKFKVDRSVLIPRPETEELAEIVINTFKLKQDDINILDVGTGSGCIAITLKHNLPIAKLYALDISAPALEIAAKNSIDNQTAVTFVHADIRNYRSSEKFHAIVSNPPYITEKEGLSMDNNVMEFEPHLALFVPNQNPLEFYIAIADFAYQNLHSDGLLFFEINANFGNKTVEMLTSKHFTDIHLLKDMQGKDRFIKARKTG